MQIKIKVLEHGKGLPIPKKATEFAACVDLYAAIPENEDCRIICGQTMLIPCGFCMEVPIGYEAQIRPRSGLAFKNSITVLNSPGTIDSDYRGEVKVILHNATIPQYKIDKDFDIHRGDRIAQMAIRKTEDFELIETTEDLTETDRGIGGFGSTGIKDAK
jgi:dUTP pyrophosphatase